MKQVFNKTLSLILYHVGDTICDLCLTKDTGSDWITGVCYDMYSWCMLKSVELDNPEWKLLFETGWKEQNK